MAISTHTKKIFIERLKRDLNNNFPSGDFSISDNEILLVIDQSLAYSMVGNVYNMAKLEGTITTPEAYLSRYNITGLTQDSNTGEWYATLPQPPVSLPLGYSITDVFFSQSAYGVSQPVLPIEAKRVPYRQYMPLPTGIRYYVKGNIIYLKESKGASLQGQNLFVEMAKTRTTDINEEMNLPDDVIETIYNLSMDKLRKRIMNPQDTIQDNLPAGPKTN